MELRQKILKSVEEVVRAAAFLRLPSSSLFIEQVALALCSCFQKKGKALMAGNGGSLCDAMHFAEELTGFYRSKRSALPAIAIADPGHISCVSNDMGYVHVFSRYVEAHGNPGDVLIVLTSSGHSQNLVEAVLEAKKRGLVTVGFLGKTGGALKGLCDLEWIVTGFPYSDRVQEAHMAAIHVIIEMVERVLFHES